MPHAVLVGSISIETIFNELEPLFVKEEDMILKTSRKYIEHDKSSILIESIVIEGGIKTEFLTLIGKRDDGIVIRVSPILEVEKITGVKRVLAETAKQIISKYSEMKIDKTNLEAWL
jgi:hypothetical protein